MTENNPNPNKLGGSLAGVRIIDLTRVLSGPFCTQMLGDHGADVIKIESPKGGDYVRTQGWFKHDFSWYFAQFNRNKRSLCLDLRSDEGKDILKQLLKDADVLVENFRPGVLDKMGLTDEYLQQTYPQLIVARINGFGSSGPYKDRPAFDFTAQAMSGFMGVSGSEASGPMRTAPPISDMVAGTNLAFGIVTALLQRQKTGRGEIVETSLVNGLIAMHAYLAAEYFVTEKQPKMTGNDHPMVYPYGLFKTADNVVAVAASNEAILQRFMTALGLADLLNDPLFSDNDKRMHNKEALRSKIEAVTTQKTTDDWVTILSDAGVPTTRVYSLEETFNDPQVLAQEMLLQLDQGKYGKVPTTGFPVKLTNNPAQIWRKVPDLGEHSDEILHELGFDDAKINTLKDQGII